MTSGRVTVRGAGIFGLSIAFAMARRGARVRVVDPHGVGAGASGGIVGALSPHVPEAWNGKKAFQLESLLMAAEWWRAVEAAAGLPTGYARSGRLQPLADARAVTVAEARGVEAATLWQGRAAWRVVPATGAAWEPASPTGLLVHDDLSARIHPRMALAALAGAVTALGGSVAQDGDDAPGPQVWATGVAGLEALGVARAAVKGQAALLAFDATGLPQLFVDGLHIVPHVDGTVAVGSTSEASWDDPRSTDAQLDALVARVRLICPALADAPVVERWAALRPRAPSRAPLLGPWPGRSGHFIANGGFKIGFGMAPLVAEVMADLMLEGRDRVPAAFSTEGAFG